MPNFVLREECPLVGQGKVLLEGTRVPASGPGTGSCIFKKTKGMRYEMFPNLTRHISKAAIGELSKVT